MKGKWHVDKEVPQMAMMSNKSYPAVLSVVTVQVFVPQKSVVFSATTCTNVVPVVMISTMGIFASIYIVYTRW